MELDDINRILNETLMKIDQEMTKTQSNRTFHETKMWYGSK